MTATYAAQFQAPRAVRSGPIDGLRAVAVFGVMLCNYRWRVPCGWMGVQLFFVLSGWLITRILLDEKAAASGAGVYFGRFYFRRALRIFPLYYAYLVMLELSHAFAGAPADWSSVRPFAFGYAVNLGMIFAQIPASAAYGHLWTLAVEEQFYLLWPLIVWWLSERALTRLAIVIVILGPLVRALSMRWGMDAGEVYVSTFSHFDALSTGALITLLDFSKLRRITLVALPLWGTAFVLGMVVLFLTPDLTWRSVGYAEGLGSVHEYIWGYTVLNFSFALLTLAAVRGELNALAQPWLCYLGRISYGIYLLHHPVYGLYFTYLEPHVPPAWPGYVRTSIGLPACAAVTIALASLSYRYFEAPLLAWRDRKAPARRSALPALGPTVAEPVTQAGAGFA